MDIIRIWYIIEHRAKQLTLQQLKNYVFFTSNPEFSAVFIKKIFSRNIRNY